MKFLLGLVTGIWICSLIWLLRQMSAPPPIEDADSRYVPEDAQ